MTTFVVYGNPAPQGSKKGFVVGGRVRMVESSDKLKPWRNDVIIEARAAHEGEPLNGPVRVTCHFTLRKPKSAPKRRQTWPDRKPDADKLVRAVLDAITVAGLVRDDAQVVSLIATKNYPYESAVALDLPGLWCEVEALA